MKCPKCGGSCWREEVRIFNCTGYGPWHCEECGWYEGWRVNAEIDAKLDAECEEAASEERLRIAASNLPQEPRE